MQQERVKSTHIDIIMCSQPPDTLASQAIGSNVTDEFFLAMPWYLMCQLENNATKDILAVTSLTVDMKAGHGFLNVFAKTHKTTPEIFIFGHCLDLRPHRDTLLEMPELWHTVLPLLRECYHNQKCPCVAYQALLICALLYYSHTRGRPSGSRSGSTHLAFHSRSVGSTGVGLPLMSQLNCSEGERLHASG